MNQISSFTIRFVGNGCWIPRAQSKQHWVVGQHKHFVHKTSNCLVKFKKRTYLSMIWFVNHHSIYHSTLTIIFFYFSRIFNFVTYIIINFWNWGTKDKYQDRAIGRPVLLVVYLILDSVRYTFYHQVHSFSIFSQTICKQKITSFFDSRIHLAANLQHNLQNANWLNEVVSVILLHLKIRFRAIIHYLNTSLSNALISVY